MTGNKRTEAFSLDGLAGYARKEGRVEDALAMQKESLRISRDVGDVQHQLDSLSRVAAAHSVAEDAELATRLLSSSLALHEEIGLSVPLYQVGRNDETLARIHAQLDEAAFAEAWEQGRAMSPDKAVELALGL